MIFSDYYFVQKVTEAESRYDVMKSTQSYEFFESLLINKRKFNIGGLSLNYVPRPSSFKESKNRMAEMAIAKGNASISSIYIPDIQNTLIAYGDVKGTIDAIIFLFSEDKQTIELFIARGYFNDVLALYEEVKGGYLDCEIEALRLKAKNVFKG